MDKRGPAVFVGVLAGICLVVQALYSFPGILGSLGLHAPGLPYTLPLLWMPALAAFLAAGLCGDENNPRLQVWPLPWKPVLALAVGLPLVFAAIGAVWALEGWARVDRGVAILAAQMPAHLHALQWGLAQRTALLGFGLALSMVLGPTLFALLWLGSEIGWRDYLLPKLLPLGRVPAYLLSGAAWGLWMAWLDVLPSESRSSWPILRYVLWGIAVGTVLAEVWRRGRSVGLAAVVLGVYFSQAAGIWQYLFVWRLDSPFLGQTGFVSISVWGVIAAVLFAWPGRAEPAESD